MKLVITIEDDIYDDYLKQGATLPKYGTAIGSLYKALWNGTPLPEQQPCEDCVSREQALEVIDTWDKFGYTYTGCFVREPKGDYVPYVHYDDMVKCIKNLPSVQPQSLEQIKWERDTAIEQLKLLGDGLGEKFEPCEDCISREDVVRILNWSKASVQMLDDYSADELVGEIITIEKEVENLLSVKPQTVTDFADKCKECGKILNETYQQKWIPVSERLPKSLEDVLATDGVDMFVAFVREKTKGKYEWYSLDVNYDKNTPIEAWMPLPQPYKEGSNGE